MNFRRLLPACTVTELNLGAGKLALSTRTSWAPDLVITLPLPLSLVVSLEFLAFFLGKGLSFVKLALFLARLGLVVFLVFLLMVEYLVHQGLFLALVL